MIIIGIVIIFLCFVYAIKYKMSKVLSCETFIEIGEDDELILYDEKHILCSKINRSGRIYFASNDLPIHILYKINDICHDFDNIYNEIYILRKCNVNN